jgi:soluble lytic murein transglycosylase-like protein
MKHRRVFRVPFAVLSISFSLVLALRPSPSDPAMIDLRRVPSDHRALLQETKELARWVSRSREGAGDLSVLHPEDLAAATSPTPRKLGLFSRTTPTEAKRRFLHDLPFGSAMTLAAERHRVDCLLVAAIVEAESGFIPDRVSPKGAIGLMQVLPSTAGEYGEAEVKNLLDPRTNLDVGSRYLGRLIDNFGGNLELAVAAYNAGPGAVERYGGVPPYTETRDYVRRVLTLYDEHHQTAGAERDPFSPLNGHFER